jgi:hypothetical protein
MPEVAPWDEFWARRRLPMRASIWTADDGCGVEDWSLFF